MAHPAAAPSPLDDTLAASHETTMPSVAGARRYSGAIPATIDANHQFLIRGEHARGGMGRILLATDATFDRPIAIKELLPGSHDDPSARARFEREARVTARLQHPSIVPVYAAGERDGRPFYAMQMVSGRTLERCIAETPTLEGRLALLPQVLAVVEAVAYAHREGILHRDLKPQNVMVGAFGEALVLDWGLAKIASEPTADGPRASTSGDLDVTLDGEMLGTPAYMPPEQARGESVDATADVYALGAMLYQLVAGRPPFRAQSLAELLAKIDGADAPPLGDDVPSDLQAIVAKAMARDPGGRYQDASELAGDLRKFLGGQLVTAHRYTAGQLFRRWLRRHRTAVAVALLAFVVLAVGGAVAIHRVVNERNRAEQFAVLAEQRRVASDQRRDAADRVIAFIVGDLTQRVRELGRVDILAKTSETVLAYYAALPSSHEPDAANRQVAALLNLGTVAIQRGSLAEAERTFELALTMTQAPALRGTVLGKLAGVATTQGLLDKAQTRLDESLALLRPLVAREPTDTRLAVLLAGQLDEAGDLAFERGDLAAAKSAFQESLELREATVRAQPSDLLTNDLTISLDGLASVAKEEGDLTRARDYAERALVLQRRVATPTSPMAYRQGLAISLSNLARIYERLGDTTAAERAYRESLVVRDRLIAEEPTRFDLQLGRVKNQYGLGTLLLDTKRPAAAREVLEQVRDIAATLVASHPDAVDAIFDLADIDEALAELYSAARKPAAHIASLRRCVAGRARVITAGSTAPTDALGLARCELQLALALGQTAEARTLAERGTARIAGNRSGDPAVLAEVEKLAAQVASP